MPDLLVYSRAGVLILRVMEFGNASQVQQLVEVAVAAARRGVQAQCREWQQLAKHVVALAAGVAASRSVAGLEDAD